MDLHSFIHIARAAESSAEAAPTGVVGLLGLNFKLFIAQLVNFTIVLFILWKWVFTPVTKALQARTKTIEKSLQDAETITKQKQEFETWKQIALKDARKEAGEIIQLSKEEAETLKIDILTAAKDEQEKIIAQGKAQLKNEKSKMLSEIKQEMASLVVGATESILKEKLDPEKDKEFIKQAIKDIH